MSYTAMPTDPPPTVDDLRKWREVRRAARQIVKHALEKEATRAADQIGGWIAASLIATDGAASTSLEADAERLAQMCVDAAGAVMATEDSKGIYRLIAWAAGPPKLQKETHRELARRS